MQDLINIKQLPIIEEQLNQIKSEVIEKVENATSLVCNEETIQTVKKVRASLNKEFTELEEKRKAVKKAVLAPYEAFEKVYKDCVTDLFKAADANLKEKVDTYEDAVKEEKRKTIVDYFNECCKASEIDFVDFDALGINITLSASEKSLMEECAKRVECIAGDIITIQSMANKDELIVEYKNNGYQLRDAIQTVLARQRQIEIEKSKPTNLNTAAPEVVDDKIYTVQFKVAATRKQLIALKQFLKDGGYDYE